MRGGSRTPPGAAPHAFASDGVVLVDQVGEPVKDLPCDDDHDGPRTLYSILTPGAAQALRKRSPAPIGALDFVLNGSLASIRTALSRPARRSPDAASYAACASTVN